MTAALAFDIYGTLIDPHGVVSELQKHIGEGAAYDSFALMTGGRLARQETDAGFEGAGGRLRLYGASLGRGRQHLDITTRIDHAAPRCETEELFKGVHDDRSRGVFQGLIRVAPHAVGTDARQTGGFVEVADFGRGFYLRVVEGDGQQFEVHRLRCTRHLRLHGDLAQHIRVGGVHGRQCQLLHQLASIKGRNFQRNVELRRAVEPCHASVEFNGHRTGLHFESIETDNLGRQVGGFLAAWVIGYGAVQAAAPRLLLRGHHGRGPDGATARACVFILALVPAGIAIALDRGYDQTTVLVCGLVVFGIVFAVNSAPNCSPAMRSMVRTFTSGSAAPASRSSSSMMVIFQPFGVALVQSSVVMSGCYPRRWALAVCDYRALAAPGLLRGGTRTFASSPNSCPRGEVLRHARPIVRLGAGF